MRFEKVRCETGRMLRVLFLLSHVLLSHILPGQDRKIDSLRHFLKSASEDTNKVIALGDLARKLGKSRSDTAIQLCRQALMLSAKLKWATGMGKAFHNLGWFCYLRRDYKSAGDHYKNALRVWEELEKADPRRKSVYLHRKASALGNIGIIFTEHGNYTRALEHYLQALKAFEAAGDKDKMASALGNIGTIYTEQKDYEKALDYFFRALELEEQLNNKSNAAFWLLNIGTVYGNQRHFDKALEFKLKALEIDKAFKNEFGIAEDLTAIGITYVEQATAFEENRNFTASDSLLSIGLDYYSESLKMNKSLGNDFVVAKTLGNIGSIYLSKNKLLEAEQFLKSSLALAQRLQAAEIIKNRHESLSELYQKKGDYKKSFEHYKKFIAFGDSLSNQENTKKQTQLEMQYEFDKKSTSDSIRQAESRKLETIRHTSEISKQKSLTYAGIAGFLVMVTVAGISFAAFRNKKKANIEIARQKALVEEKQKEILDSIHYARRIQKALITSEKYIERKLNAIKG